MINTESNTETSFEVNRVINRYWQLNQNVIQNIQRYCETKEHKLVLEICTGFEQFVLATDFI